VGEAGEVADAHKKLWFHAPKDRLHDIKLELGDVLYYQSKLHNIYGVTMEELLAMNKAKLFERYEVISI
jgi:NTP pyrophosphatase (non-canonical NTP hydrolase)